MKCMAVTIRGTFFALFAPAAPCHGEPVAYNVCRYKVCLSKMQVQIGEERTMSGANITRQEFLRDRQGRTFADVLNDPEQPFDEVLGFFSDENRLRRMEESEIHHDRPPLAGVVRELESQPVNDRFLAAVDLGRTKRFRQAIGVVVRIMMARRGWRKTGRKGSLGVRTSRTASHNTGGLALWFIRGERYEREDGMPFRSVRDRCQELESAALPRQSSVAT